MFLPYGMNFIQEDKIKPSVIRIMGMFLSCGYFCVMKYILSQYKSQRNYIPVMSIISSKYCPLYLTLFPVVMLFMIIIILQVIMIFVGIYFEILFASRDVSLVFF